VARLGEVGHVDGGPLLDVAIAAQPREGTASRAAAVSPTPAEFDERCGSLRSWVFVPTRLGSRWTAGVDRVPDCGEEIGPAQNEGVRWRGGFFGVIVCWPLGRPLA